MYVLVYDTYPKCRKHADDLHVYVIGHDSCPIGRKSCEPRCYHVLIGEPVSNMRLCWDSCILELRLLQEALRLQVVNDT